MIEVIHEQPLQMTAALDQAAEPDDPPAARAWAEIDWDQAAKNAEQEVTRARAKKPAKPKQTKTARFGEPKP